MVNYQRCGYDIHAILYLYTYFVNCNFKKYELISEQPKRSHKTIRATGVA